MDVRAGIQELVETTPLVDTHEHLIEESVRLSGQAGTGLFPCDDWAYLFMHYLADDLLSAGMSGDSLKRFLAPDTATEAKYRLIAPWWAKAKHTGYGQSVRYTLRGLYDIEDLTDETVFLLAERYRERVRPGFYRYILQEKANLTACHVNSLTDIFTHTAQPGVLYQDIGFPSLSSDLNLERVEKEFGKTADTLDGWLEILDTIFAECGPNAVAAKNQSAYSRRLDYSRVEKSVAEPLFARFAKKETLSPDEGKALQDFLFRYCLQKATEQGLPVKLHTGYYAGTGRMPLHRVRDNAADLCPLLQDFPETTFVLMHLGYPYQDEAIALAKQYANVKIDMCWTWIINPVASVRFLKEFLLAVPANKLFPFGGDYITVETVYGHSHIARKGITQALTELLEEGWLKQEEIPDLVARLLHGNAEETFPIPKNDPSRTL